MAAGSEYAAGTTGGNNSITLASGQIPSLNITGSTAKSTTVAVNNTGSTVATATVAANGVGSTSTAGQHSHTTSSIYHGVVSDWSQSGGNTLYGYVTAVENALTTSVDGNHNHSLNIPSLTVPSTKLNIPTLTVNSATVTAAYTNNSLASVDVTNKYLAVYMWKRVA